jgi:ABC-type uncharacterized transport system ATPase subunit
MCQQGWDESVLAARLAHLARALAVDKSWRTKSVSDGQLRRMQLALKLMAPRDVIFLDGVCVCHAPRMHTALSHMLRP